MILEISGDFEPQMSTNSELPRGAAEQGVDFDVALLGRLLDCVEAFARRKDRASFRSRPQVTRERSGSASNTQLMADSTEPLDSQRLPELGDLPPFWRTLVLSKDRFAAESDFYASIRALCQIQAAVSELLAPYLKASLIAMRQPGAMHDFASDLNRGLAGVPTDGRQDRPLLEQTVDSTSPYTEDGDFLAQVIEMRGWDENGAVLRGLLLLAHLGRIGGHKRLMFWLQEPNLALSGDSPIALIVKGKWGSVADLADNLLTCWQRAESVSEE
jgi:hypothetical protein